MSLFRKVRYCGRLRYVGAVAHGIAIIHGAATDKHIFSILGLPLCILKKAVFITAQLRLSRYLQSKVPNTAYVSSWKVPRIHCCLVPVRADLMPAHQSYIPPLSRISPSRTGHKDHPFSMNQKRFQNNFEVQ